MAFLKSRTGVGGSWRREMPPEPSYSRSALMPRSRRRLEKPRRKPPPRLPQTRMGPTLTTRQLDITVRRPVGGSAWLPDDERRQKAQPQTEDRIRGCAHHSRPGLVPCYPVSCSSHSSCFGVSEAPG